MNKIGVIGSGVVAQALASGFIKHGFEVMMGTSDSTKLTEWLSNAGNKGSVGSLAEAASFGDMIVFSVKGTAAEKLILELKDYLKGKTVIDTTNPLNDSPPVNGVLSYFTGPNESLMERLQNLVPDAHFIKAFSCIGSSFMINPSFNEGIPTMFICGNNDHAKAEVKKIVELFGFDVADMGKMEAARAIEPLAMLWCIPGFLNNNWSHAFKLMYA
ncbi:NAD(P)-binding domain-containing protein [Solitalea sp. MAHUQ-68]|uniref:NAD(P)-binding domain-containing protein n=1 Tax=Solitalea agri TaxID=2953739 RepID=A0A9X2F5E4_9SPHI|nr:NAD(P)-binding domain-containing protein [Solitalea agri]MCO4292248.1 NAD(P)-binding domain-containing protein [Solitalea agri]